MEFDNEMIADIEKILSNNKCSNDYYLPISELDDIRVSAKIRKFTTCSGVISYHFCVALLGVHHSWDKQFNGRYDLFSSKDLDTLPKTLKFIEIFLENFSVDLVNGKFVTESRPESKTKAKLAIMLRKNPRVKVNMDECCVCKDTETTSKTPCGHFVCIRCVSKLPMADEDPDFDDDEYDGMCFDRKCPMCRQTFCQLE